jgi:hypothetical protein
MSVASGVGVLALGALTGCTSVGAQAVAHVSNSFALTVQVPVLQAARLFGPSGERAWAGDEWQPAFLFPVPEADVEGAVFTVRHGAHTSVWVNTVFDPAAGRLQYVYVLGDLLVTTIDVRLHAIDTTRTGVEVTYVRTALRPEANAHVEEMGRTDRGQGKVWEDAIAAYLRRAKDRS